jgi:hypothetical protein
MKNNTTKTADNVNSNLWCNCLNKRPENLSPCTSFPETVIMPDVEVIITDILFIE